MFHNTRIQFRLYLSFFVSLIAALAITIVSVFSLLSIKTEMESLALDEAVSSQMSGSITASLFMLSVVAVVGIVAFLVLSLLVIRSVGKPLSQLTNSTEKLSKGDFGNIHGSNNEDELGVALNNLSAAANTFNNLLNDVTTTQSLQLEGNLSAFVDESKYSGSYLDVAKTVNGFLSNNNNDFYSILNALDSISNGNFNCDIKSYPNDKAVVNKSVDALRGNLNKLNLQIDNLTRDIHNGVLDKKPDLKALTGDWQTLASHIYDAQMAIYEPVREVSLALLQIAKGNLSIHITGDYKGEFAIIKNSLNTTLNVVEAYTKNVNNVFKELAQNNFDFDVTAAFVGDFRDTRKHILDTLDMLNKTLGLIDNKVQKVSFNSHNLLASCSNIASGTSDQTGSITNLTNILERLLEQTNKNEERAKSSDALSFESRQNATDGNNRMKEMLVSMEAIKTASANISTIMKVIDDIAFQTNLLAVNASIESARAGIHGKGFAVVADEVRNLASRSQSAAQETTQLINDSIEKVNEGTKIANLTASYLEKIVSNVSSVSDIISDIATSTSEQANSISDLNRTISNISNMMQSSTAMSKENAQSSKELSSESDMLKNVSASFKIRPYESNDSVAMPVKFEHVPKNTTPPAEHKPSYSTTTSDSSPAKTFISKPATLKPTTVATAKPAVTTTAKPAVTTTAKPAVTTTAKPAVTATAKPAVTTTAKPAVTATAKPAVTATTKPAVATTAKPAVMATAKPAVATTAKPTPATAKQSTAKLNPTAIQKSGASSIASDANVGIVSNFNSSDFGKY